MANDASVARHLNVPVGTIFAMMFIMPRDLALPFCIEAAERVIEHANLPIDPDDSVFGSLFDRVYGWLKSDEVELEVLAPLTGIAAPAEGLHIASHVRLEKIFDVNLPGIALSNPLHTPLGIPAESAGSEVLPVFGLRLTTFTPKVFSDPGKDYLANRKLLLQRIATIVDAFLRALALRGVARIGTTGQIVRQINWSGTPQAAWHLDFAVAALAGQSIRVTFEPNDQELLERLFVTLTSEYFETREGRSILSALDRYRSATERSISDDINLDLTIAAEILFGFGMGGSNEDLALRTRLHASVFFGDDETPYDRDRISEVVGFSYRVRSDTVHGRVLTESKREQLDINNRAMFDLIARALWMFVEARPENAKMKQIWSDRVRTLLTREPLCPIHEAMANAR